MGAKARRRNRRRRRCASRVPPAPASLSRKRPLAAISRIRTWRGLGFVVGHLRGKTAAGRQFAGEPRDDADMAGDPVKNRVGEDEVRAVDSPMRGVALNEARIRQASARRRKHLARCVYSEKVRAGIFFAQRRRRNAAAATEIDDMFARAHGHSRQQIHGGALSFSLEAAVDLGSQAFIPFL